MSELSRRSYLHVPLACVALALLTGFAGVGFVKVLGVAWAMVVYWPASFTVGYYVGFGAASKAAGDG